MIAEPRSLSYWEGELKKPFHEAFKEARIAAGLSQAKAAEVLEVSKSVVEKWERDDRTPIKPTQVGALTILEAVARLRATK